MSSGGGDTTAELKSIPLMLVEGLEGESFTLSLVDDDWLVIRKISSIDIPNNVDSIKNGDIKLYSSGLNLFEVCGIHICLSYYSTYCIFLCRVTASM